MFSAFAEFWVIAGQGATVATVATMAVEATGNNSKENPKDQERKKLVKHANLRIVTTVMAMGDLQGPSTGELWLSVTGLF